MTDFEFGNRKYVIIGVAVAIVLIYLIRLFGLQIASSDYKKNADSNAFLRKNEFPSRGVIKDRNNKLMVYNQLTYDLMVVTNEMRPSMDTTDFCRCIGISKDEFIERMDNIKNPDKNPSYSRFSQQLFLPQLTMREFNVLHEKMFRFPGFYVQKRAIRQYHYPYAAHVLGEVAQVSPSDIEEDDYYQPGDYIGKIGVERYYEEYLRGEKGVHVMLRDARGRIQGSYKNGAMDKQPRPGRNLTLGLDIELQKLGEKLMRGRKGSIVAIEPSTGEILCMVSAPSYDPRLLVGRNRGKNHMKLQENESRPLLNRAITGLYPPGSTFKPAQGLVFLQEGISNAGTAYPCHGGFVHKGLKVGCHYHNSPLTIGPALATSCNGFFCWGLYYMMSNRRKYRTIDEAMNKWRDYMVSMGFGYKLGVDLPGEKRGLIPNAEFYNKAYSGRWNGLTIISISIGQGEVLLTPLQIANQAATIANRGFYYIPHVVKEVQGLPLDTIYTERHYTMAKSRYYDYIVQGMRSAVVGGTCSAANIPGLSICGKTGTVQNRGSDHSVFMGFAPMRNPKIAIAVYVENGGFGAASAVPIAGQMFRGFFNSKKD
ncbi:MAG: penicillin-binding protein 2 [Prevotellaceae bacterium]|nr:penicillin-binding protein 2 [Prevotellaceae bacterium]